MTGKIKLVHSGGNAVSIAVPTSNPSASEVEFKLPQTDGSSGQAMVTDASGNLSFANKGKFASYAILADVKSDTTDSGSFTSGDWRTRDLNTEIADADNIVSISNNQFTLQAGSYLIEIQATAYRVNKNMVKLYNVTDSADTAFGSSMYASAGYNGGNISYLSVRTTISAAKTFEIRHRCQSNNTSHGFGQASDFGNNELYLIVKIFKES